MTDAELITKLKEIKELTLQLREKSQNLELTFNPWLNICLTQITAKTEELDEYLNNIAIELM